MRDWTIRLAVVVSVLWAMTLPLPAADSRTAAEWLGWTSREAAREKAALDADPELAALFRGAATCCDPYYDAASKKMRNGGGLAAAGDIAAFEAFVAGPGAELAEHIVTGGLPADSERYRPVLQARVLWQCDKVLAKKRQKKESLAPGEVAWLGYYDAVLARGKAALRDAYRSGTIERSALDDIRAYALLLDIQCTGGKFLPFSLGLMESSGLAPGDPAPDLCLAKAAPLLAGPGFAPPSPFDSLRPLTWGIVTDMLQALTGYETDANGHIAAKPSTAQPPAGAEPGDYVRITDFRGKKPVLLILGDATDTYCCHGIVLSKLEDVYRVFRDRVEIYWVNDSVHDTRMPYRDYFAERPADTGGVAMHPLDMATRAATARSFYMAYPYTSIPCVLDNMAQTARNAFGDRGGEGAFWLIDVDGRIAYKNDGPNECSGWEWNKLAVTHIIRTDCLVRAIEALLASGGKYDPQRPGKCSHVKIDAPEWAKTAKPGLGTVWLAATVVSVDAAGARLTVTRDQAAADDYPGLRWWDGAPAANAQRDGLPDTIALVKKWTDPDASRSLALSLAEGAYLSLDGNACALTGLRPGDRLGAQVKPSDAARGECPAFVVRAYRLGIK